MSSDKLNLTARAAGFAMACDETVGGPVPKPLAPAPLLLAKPDAPPAQTSVLAPLRNAKIAFSWSFPSWSLGKTA